MSDRFGSSVRLREERSSRVELFVRDLNAIGGDGVRSPGRTESERERWRERKSRGSARGGVSGANLRSVSRA